MFGRLPASVSVRLLVGVILSGTLSVLDSTIVVPLLGSIGEEFGGGTEVSWLVSAYLLASTVTIPLWGRWMDLRGERLPMWIALLVFLIGTIACVCAPSLWVLVLGRVVQGIGTGGVVPVGQAILAARCSTQERAKLQIYYNVAYGTAAGLGPIVGGALLDVSWRWAFVLIIPFIFAVAFALYGQLSPTPKSGELRPFDALGSAIITIGLTVMLIGVERTSWWPIALGMLLLAWYVMRTKRVPNGPIPRGLLTHRAVMAAAFIGLLIGFVQFSYLTYLPMFSESLNQSLNSGLVVVPLTVLWLSLGAFTGVLAVKFGSRMMMLAAILTAVPAGLIVIASFSLPTFFLASALIGASAGFALIPALLLAQHAAPMADIGAATSSFVLFCNFGRALGVAVVAVVLQRAGVNPAMVVLTVVALLVFVPYAMTPRKSAEQQLRSAQL